MIHKEVAQKTVQALKESNKEDRRVYSNILNAMNNRAKALHNEYLEDKEAIEVISKLVKQNKESLDTCPEERKDIKDKLEYERRILMAYMPKQLSKEEIVEVINDTIKELGVERIDSKNRGRITGAVISKTKGIADGKEVSTIINSMIQ